ncbi:MAG: deoxyguanosinetriphosphate triphosphohydrolase [Chloroflexi bacterium]|nr:deoxyguanosinetriphosphate triphosphohydrolase [Chloroflexota bacterium]
MMRVDIRARIEDGEERLSPLAAKSRYTRGRLLPEEPSPMRTDFQRDRDRVVHSKAFRRLKHKTQVFISPLGDHFVTRLTHTLEVAQIARSIARALNLNEDLTEAIALAHDLGHTPFGHVGEDVLDEMHPGGFRHNEQSLRVVDILEKDGAGLNLTSEVRDGILKHSKIRASISAEAWGVAATLEGQIVKIADSIAYINHDIGDAIRAGVLSNQSLPVSSVRVLGHKHSDRINTMVCDVIDHSFEQSKASESSPRQSADKYAECYEQIAASAAQNRPLITMSPAILAAVDELREFLFQKVYSAAMAEQESAKAKELLRLLYRHFRDRPEQLPTELRSSRRDESVERMVCDYVSGMTDRYALQVFEDLYLPRLRTAWG